MKETWYNVFNYMNYPAVSYGFAVDKDGICCKVNDNFPWMRGRTIDFLKKFFEDKPVYLTEIKVNAKSDDPAIGCST